MMSRREHHDVRTTLTLDEDVAARIRAEARRSGRPFKTLVNELLRSGLALSRAPAKVTPFRIEAEAFGGLRPGLSIDSIGGLLEQIEGPAHR